MKVIVERKELLSVATKIGTLVDFYKSEYLTLNKEYDVLQTSWDGSDADLFREKWTELNSKKASYENQITMLQNYASYLKKCENEYKKTETFLKNKAIKLPR